ncbi:MAG: flagellar basal body rod protein FlgB [Planctomycetota bacterium]
MIRGLFEREAIPVLEASLAFAAARQKAIQNNIANVDTPYYKRETVPEAEFDQALAQAIEERARAHPNRFVMSDTRNIEFVQGGTVPLVRNVPGPDAGPERHDRNNVEIEKEMVDLAKNTLYIEALQRLLKKDYNMLLSALRDRIA